MILVPYITSLRKDILQRESSGGKETRENCTRLKPWNWEMRTDGWNISNQVRLAIVTNHDLADLCHQQHTNAEKDEHLIREDWWITLHDLATPLNCSSASAHWILKWSSLNFVHVRSYENSSWGMHELVTLLFKSQLN